jgi:hypothetical protein
MLIATPLPDGPDWPTTAPRHLSVFGGGVRARGATAIEPWPTIERARVSDRDQTVLVTPT